jgi:hypothetical protein
MTFIESNPIEAYIRDLHTGGITDQPVARSALPSRASRLAPTLQRGSVWPALQRRVSAVPSPMQRARDAGAPALAPTPERGSQSPRRRPSCRRAASVSLALPASTAWPER